MPDTYAPQCLQSPRASFSVAASSMLERRRHGARCTGRCESALLPLTTSAQRCLWLPALTAGGGDPNTATSRCWFGYQRSLRGGISASRYQLLPLACSAHRGPAIASCCCYYGSLLPLAAATASRFQRSPRTSYSLWLQPLATASRFRHLLLLLPLATSCRLWLLLATASCFQRTAASYCLWLLPLASASCCCY